MPTDRQTEMTKLIVAFSNFTKAPKKGLHIQVCLKSGKSNTLQEDLSKFIRRGILVINVTIVFMVTVFTSFTTVINISVFCGYVNAPDVFRSVDIFKLATACVLLSMPRFQL
jgi:formylmethanofuran:tetrahydromethanopterin formyltransferase